MGLGEKYSLDKVSGKLKETTVGMFILEVVSLSVLLNSLVPQETFSAIKISTPSDKIVIVVILSVVLVFLYFFAVRFNEDSNQIQATGESLKELVEKKKSQNDISPREAFNFYKEKFGYHFKKTEIEEDVQCSAEEDRGSAKGKRRICLIIEKSNNYFSHKDYFMAKDGRTIQPDEPNNNRDFSGSFDEVKRIEQVGCDNRKESSIKCDNCHRCNFQSLDGKGKIEARLIQENTNKAVYRYSFKNISSYLGKPAICRYNVVDMWPPGSFALTINDLEKKQKELSSELKTDKEGFYFQVDDPIEYLKIHLKFPACFCQVNFSMVAALKDNFEHIVYSEKERIFDDRPTKDERLPYELILTIDYPIIGLVYGYEWEPLDKITY